ncbi:steroid hormone receptor ERR2-like [Symsagittifera roscoffensis]|uniref:steroid hormone receptor ERR2-like n=1 Tax=Symsagittifera roscoffensis TaxID=84072 RepID=UPI00307C3F7B
MEPDDTFELETEFEQDEKIYCGEDFRKAEPPLCKVCGDLASGKHYGALSCEGCKAFFKRSIKRKPTSKCKQLLTRAQKPPIRIVNGEKRCLIEKKTRNDCQKCRYDLCLEVGMSKNNLTKYRHNDEKKTKTPDSDSTPFTGSKCSESPEDSDLSEKNLNENALSADDLQLIEDLTGIEADKIPEDHPMPDIADGEIPSSVNHEKAVLYLSGFDEQNYVTQWAQKVPDFAQIPQDDQKTILKKCFLDILILRLAWRSAPHDEKIRFTIGRLISKEEGQRIGLDMDLFAMTLFFIRHIKSIGLDIVEISLLQAILLTFARRDSIQNSSQKIATGIQNRVMRTLCSYVKSYYPTQPLRYCKIIQLISSIHGVSLKAMDDFLTDAINGTIMLNESVCSMVT